MFIKVRTYYKKYKLRIQLISINIVIAVIPIIVLGWISYNKNVDSVKKDVSASVDILFNQVNGRLNEYFDSIGNMSKVMFFNKSLQNTSQGYDFDIIAQGVESEHWTYETQYNFIRSYLNSFTEASTSIKGILLTNIGIKDGTEQVTEYSTSIGVKSYVSDFVKNMDIDKYASGRLYFTEPFAPGSEHSDEILAFRVIKSILPGNLYDSIFIGTIVLDRKILDEFINDKNLNKTAEVFLTNKSNVIIASSNISKNGMHMNGSFLFDADTTQFAELDGVSYMVKTDMIKTGWKLIALIPLEGLYKEAEVIKYSITIIILVIFLIEIALNYFLNLFMTKPIRKLADACDRVASGDLKAEIVLKGDNEITVIANKFNNMVVEVKALTQRIINTQQMLYETELQKKQFELGSLQAQINSHFLRNTLYCMRGMAFSNEMQDFDKVICNLVSFFQYNENNAEMVSLNEELRYINIYAEIQKVRFHDKFRIVFDIEKDLEVFRIPKFIIQPLVENAIFHGVERKVGAGIIKVNASSTGESVVIKVLDNGIGMDAASLQNLKQALFNNETLHGRKDERRSIGISNINSRLQLFFNTDYSMNIKSWVGFGTVVIIKIHMRKESDGNV